MGSYWSRRCLAVLDETATFGRDSQTTASSAAYPEFLADLADTTRRPVGMPGDHDTDYSARNAALLAARSIRGEWPSYLASPSATAHLIAEPSWKVVRIGVLRPIGCLQVRRNAWPSNVLAKGLNEPGAAGLRDEPMSTPSQRRMA